MGARLRVFLTPEEDRTLFELRTAKTVPQRVKDRAEVVYGLVVGSFDGERYITMMDEQARQAKAVLEETGRIRVIVQDNGPVHTCKQVKAKWPEWEAQGLYFFFLPKYCSEMNPIETEWHQLKTHELRGQMFEGELDLAYAVIDGVTARAEVGGYEAERFRFPPKSEAS
jgi:transposase